MGEPQFETTVPLTGYVVVRKNGDDMTVFSVSDGDNLSVTLARENPRD